MKFWYFERTCAKAYFINSHVAVSSRTKGINLGLGHHLQPYFMGATKALASLHICADLSVPSLLNIVISTKISIKSVLKTGASLRFNNKYLETVM